MELFRIFGYLLLGLIYLDKFVFAYDPETCIKCRASHICNPPECFCCRDTMPMETHNIPQMVFFSFDDAVTPPVSAYYKELFDSKRKNPNGCPISMTLFISHKNTVYKLVREFYDKGMEIASHSVTHGHPSPRTFLREAKTQKENLAKMARIPESKITGWRSPFLEPLGDIQPAVLKDLGYEYDATLTMSKMNEADKAVTPFTLDFGWPYDCKIKPCPKKEHKGFWEVPVISVKDYLKRYDCVYVDGCNNPPPSERMAYKFLWDNFQNYYTTNRAPMGINMHASWFYYPDRKRAMDRFIKDLVKLKDVYIISIQQVIAWLKQPTPLHRLNDFAPWQCNGNGNAIDRKQKQIKSTLERKRQERRRHQKRVQQQRQMQIQREKMEQQNQKAQQSKLFAQRRFLPSMSPQQQRQTAPMLPAITWPRGNIPSAAPIIPSVPKISIWWTRPDSMSSPMQQQRQIGHLQMQQEKKKQAALQKKKLEEEQRLNLENQRKAEEQARLLELKRQEELKQRQLAAAKQKELQRLRDLEQKRIEEMKRQEILKHQQMEKIKEAKRQKELEKQKQIEMQRIRERKRKELLKKQEKERQRQELLKQQQIELKRKEELENIRQQERLRAMEEQRQEEMKQDMIKNRALEKQRLEEIRIQKQQALQRTKLEEIKQQELLKQREERRLEKIRQQEIRKKQKLQKIRRQQEMIKQQETNIQYNQKYMQTRAATQLNQILQFNQNERMRQLELLSLPELKKLQNELQRRLSAQDHQSTTEQTLSSVQNARDKSVLNSHQLDTSKTQTLVEPDTMHLSEFGSSEQMLLNEYASPNDITKTRIRSKQAIQKVVTAMPKIRESQSYRQTTKIIREAIIDTLATTPYPPKTTDSVHLLAVPNSMEIKAQHQSDALKNYEAAPLQKMPNEILITGEQKLVQKSNANALPETAVSAKGKKQPMELYNKDMLNSSTDSHLLINKINPAQSATVPSTTNRQSTRRAVTNSQEIVIPIPVASEKEPSKGPSADATNVSTILQSRHLEKTLTKKQQIQTRSPHWLMNLIDFETLQGPWQTSSIKFPTKSTPTKAPEVVKNHTEKSQTSKNPVSYRFFSLNDIKSTKSLFTKESTHPILFGPQEKPTMNMLSQEPEYISFKSSPVPVSFRYHGNSLADGLKTVKTSNVVKTHTTNNIPTTTTITSTTTKQTTTKTITTTASPTTTTTLSSTTTTLPTTTTNAPTTPTTSTQATTSTSLSSTKPTVIPRKNIYQKIIAPKRSFMIPSMSHTGDTPHSPLYSTKEFSSTVEPSYKCKQGENCVVPNCVCKSNTTPNGLPRDKIPQMVYLTVDGSLNFHTYKKINSLFTGKRNPNGCKIKGTMFVTDSGSSYRISSALNSDGIEVAMMGMSSRAYSSFRKLQIDVPKQRNRIAKSSGILLGEIKGWRSPGLKPLGDDQFNLLSNHSLYDSSLIMDRSAKNQKKPWPFTMDYGWEDTCEINTCPSAFHPGVWEVPIVPFKGLNNTGSCEYTDGCASQPRSEKETIAYLMDNFNAYYKTNRAPFAIRLKQVWFHWYYRQNLSGLLKFLDIILSYGDVYVTSISDMLEWVKKPTEIKDINQFEPWKCK